MDFTFWMYLKILTLRYSKDCTVHFIYFSTALYFVNNYYIYIYIYFCRNSVKLMFHIIRKKFNCPNVLFEKFLFTYWTKLKLYILRFKNQGKNILRQKVRKNNIYFICHLFYFIFIWGSLTGFLLNAKY